MNASHVRAVSATLPLTEEAMERIERLLADSSPGVMRRVAEVAPERQR